MRQHDRTCCLTLSNAVLADYLSASGIDETTHYTNERGQARTHVGGAGSKGKERVSRIVTALWLAAVALVHPFTAAHFEGTSSMTGADLPNLLPQMLPRLWAFALRICGDRHDAEDLVQRACVRALERTHQLQPDTAPLSWMFSIVHSTWINELRARNVRARTGKEWDDEFLETVADARACAPKQYVTNSQIVSAVQRLPENTAGCHTAGKKGGAGTEVRNRRGSANPDGSSALCLKTHSSHSFIARSEESESDEDEVRIGRAVHRKGTTCGLSSR